MSSWKGVYPKTISALQSAGFQDFIAGFEFELQSQNLKLDFRWFPVFLKMRNSPRRLQALAEFEYLRALVYSMQLGLPKLDSGVVAVNPSAQFLEVHDDLPEIGRGPGLYCFLKWDGRFFEMELSLPQALLLDLLREDRKFSPGQLVEQAQIHQVKIPLSQQEWKSVLDDLILRGIILSGSALSSQSGKESIAVLLDA